jgi:hypothetical protein
MPLRAVLYSLSRRRRNADEEPAAAGYAREVAAFGQAAGVELPTISLNRFTCDPIHETLKRFTQQQRDRPRIALRGSSPAISASPLAWYLVGLRRAETTSARAAKLPGKRLTAELHRHHTTALGAPNAEVTRKLRHPPDGTHGPRGVNNCQS